MPAPPSTTTTTTAAPGPWVCAPLCAGSIAGTCYDFTIPGLSPNTIYNYRAYMIVCGVEYCGNTFQVATTPTPLYPPTVTTATIGSITTNSATSGGNVTADGGSAVTARGVAYGVSSSPTIVGSHTSDGSGTGAFVSTISGLALNTTYYVRAYATNAQGTAYGNEVSFITLSATIPTVHIAGPTWTWSPVLTANNVVNVSDDGGSPITARGTIWSLTSPPSMPPVLPGDAWTNYPPFGTGTFTAQMHCNQLYGPSGVGSGYWFYRAFACNAVGIAYSPEAYVLDLG